MEWYRVTKTDTRARLLADKHYSRQSIGHHEFCPPGNSIVLIIPTGDFLVATALWVSHRPDPSANVGRMDNLDYWDNPYFRNESGILSSLLISEALAVTRHIWRDVMPEHGFHSFVDPRKIKSRNPGYCFQCAGFYRDTQRTTKGLLRYRMDLAQLLEITPQSPNYQQMRLFA